jgi:H+/Cl- antiporter ClcA
MLPSRHKSNSNSARRAAVDDRVFMLSGIAVPLGIASGFIALGFVKLLNVITNLSFFGRLSAGPASPADHHLGLWVLAVPVAGGLIVGLMARYGSKAIRGHGIPEAMEQVLTNQSRIPPRVLVLKPLSAAVSIGTGGPFGAEGPIIATGGALGSLIGQVLHTTADERKILLAAGAAAGMTAIFGSPVSAVLLSIELLLFEFRPRSLIPICLAVVSAMGTRLAIIQTTPAFAMHDVVQPVPAALAVYVLIGALVGAAAIVVTKLVYAVEDAFEELPIHWMWWPAIGAVAVGLVGLYEPRTLGVGYDNIERVLGGGIAGRALLMLAALKFVSWSISLGSGTSGGTLAPLFTIGGALGAWLGECAASLLPSVGIDPRVAGLVGMASIFSGSARALLASVVFAFETTRQPLGLLPLLGGATMAYLLSWRFMRNSIMTEKIERRGIRVPSEYEADHLHQFQAGQAASKKIYSIPVDRRLGEVRAWLNSSEKGSNHQGYPVLDGEERLVGIVTRRDLLDQAHDDSAVVGALVRREPVTIFEDETLAEARDLMALVGVGRLAVLSREEPDRLIGMLSRSDILGAHLRRLKDKNEPDKGLPLSW